MTLSVGKILGLCGIVGLILSFGVLVGAAPASAAPPVNAWHYPAVLGVDGSTMSIAQMNVSPATRMVVISQLGPAVAVRTAGASTPAMVTQWRVDNNRRHYIQISGTYCKNKTGGVVFVADGAPVDPELTC